MNFVCPICNKAGLSDYKKTEVVCPQCNSDLKPFMLLENVSKSQTPKRTYLIIACVSLLSIIFLGMLLKTNSVKQQLVVENEILTDSLEIIQGQLISTRLPEYGQSKGEEQIITLEYVVKKGDYPYKIAQFFYGDGNLYKQIEADNNLVQPYTLKVGQVLEIKLKKDG